MNHCCCLAHRVRLSGFSAKFFRRPARSLIFSVLQGIAATGFQVLSGSFRFFQDSSVDLGPLRDWRRTALFAFVRFCAVLIRLRMVPSGGVQWLFGDCSAIGAPALNLA